MAFIQKRLFRLNRKLFSSVLIKNRTLLTSQYWCQDEWNKRFDQDETLKHISAERYFFELNQRYQQKQPVSAVDVDIFVNSIRRPESQIELEHILKRFRQTPRTVYTLESTHHAVCRFYMDHKKLKELLEILNQRVQFGIFPDVFSYNVLLDRCIQAEDLVQAFDVVKLMMLQEDGGNEITKTLAIHVLERLLTNGLVGQPAEPATSDETSEQNDDDEIEYIRVPYLTNPYFDDHFDLVNRDHIFGKCLYFFGRELEKSPSSSPDDRILANTCMIIGLVFYQKWDRLNKLIDRLSAGEGNFPITSEPQQIITRLMEHSTEEDQKQLSAIKARLEASSQPMNKTMADLIAKRIEKLPTLEPNDMEQMRKMLVQFSEIRASALAQQMEKLMEEKRSQELQQLQKEFEEKKRLYYFFENFPKHEIDFVEAEKRIQEIRSKTVVEEDYMPPERY